MNDETQPAQEIIVFDPNSIRNLAVKMIKIMDEVKYVEKKGKNEFHKYNYAMESDVVRKCSDAMVKHKVFMFTSVVDYKREPLSSNAKQSIVTIKTNVTFVDADTGESFTTSFYGDGADSGDKGVYKAITGANKYTLMKTFGIETGNDPEHEKMQELEVASLTKADIEKNLIKAANEGGHGLKLELSMIGGKRLRQLFNEKDFDRFSDIRKAADERIQKELDRDLDEDIPM